MESFVEIQYNRGLCRHLQIAVTMKLPAMQTMPLRITQKALEKHILD
jgi:hypothetical protein